MKPCLLILLTCLLNLCSPLHAGAADTDWTYYLSYHDATQVTRAGKVVYALMGDNLVSLDTEDSSVREIDRFAGLSDKGIAFIGYSATAKALVIYYKNNNVDLLFDNGRIVNLPQIKNYTNLALTANSLTVCGDIAIVATQLGVILLDVKREEVKAFYNYERTVFAGAIMGGDLYLALSDKVVRGHLSDNLYYLSNFQSLFGMRVTQILPAANGVYMVVPFIATWTDKWAGVCYLEATSGTEKPTITRLTDHVVKRGRTDGSRHAFVSASKVLVADAENPMELKEYDLADGGNDVVPFGSTSLWVAQGSLGAQAFVPSSDETALTATGETISQSGPRRDLCYSLRYAPDNTLYVCGGRPDYTDAIKNAGSLFRFDGKNWDDMEEDTVLKQTGNLYTNLSSVAFSPKNPAHIFATAYGTGLYEFENGKFVKHYTPNNSPIKSALASTSGSFLRYVRTGGCAFDEDENLWILQNYTDSALLVLKPDGQWKSLYSPSLSSGVANSIVKADSKGRIWSSVKFETGRSSGLNCFDYGGTIDDESDDYEVFRSAATNEDDTSVSLAEVKDFCFDKEGQLWIGCANGVFVVEDPDEWFDSSFKILQPKVPRNDGTNYADYLLTGVTVHAIAVDGGNRKWLGTIGGGLYLVSADGSEILEHFTTADSPLLSDNIFSLAINEETGELMIGTDAGLCSYRTGVSRAMPTLSKNQIKVYPNPVRPEFNGMVTISGLTDGADVKIVSAGSQLVASGTAVGGSFRWDVRDASGRRVGSGVYYVMITTADGSTAVAAKFVVI